MPGSAQVTNKVTTFMINKVQTVADANVEMVVKLFGKLATLSTRTFGEATPGDSTPEWSESFTPFRAKKARRLTGSPTDESMD